MVTQSELKRIFEYIDGQLVWKISPCYKVSAGDIAGNLHPSGYIRIVIKGVTYMAHKLIYLYHTGEHPKYLDHIDRDRSNNNINNLRPCTLGQNQYNSKLKSNNTSGVKNVCWNKSKNRWVARLSVDKQSKHIGTFIDLKEAALAVNKARKLYHKEFSCSG